MSINEQRVEKAASPNLHRSNVFSRLAPLLLLHFSEVVHETHEAWKRLVNGETAPGDVSIANSSVQGSKGIAGVSSSFVFLFGFSL